jgi:hypothetical protein
MGNQMNASGGAGNQRNIIIAVVVAVVLLCCCCLLLGVLWQYGDQLMLMFNQTGVRPLASALRL